MNRATAAGVEALVVTGTGLAGSRAGRADLAEQTARAALYATAGVHPHSAVEAMGELADGLQRAGPAATRRVQANAASTWETPTYSPQADANPLLPRAQPELATELACSARARRPRHVSSRAPLISYCSCVGSTA